MILFSVSVLYTDPVLVLVIWKLKHESFLCIIQKINEHKKKILLSELYQTYVLQCLLSWQEQQKNNFNNIINILW